MDRLTKTVRGLVLSEGLVSNGTATRRSRAARNFVSWATSARPNFAAQEPQLQGGGDTADTGLP